MQKSLRRIRFFSIGQVFHAMRKTYIKGGKLRRDRRFRLGRNQYKPSAKLWTFFTKGISCYLCGRKGEFFTLEKHQDTEIAHLNLYGIDSEGKELLFTIDHLIPLAAGGKKGDVNNLRTCCAECNVFKGNLIPAHVRQNRQTNPRRRLGLPQHG